MIRLQGHHLDIPFHQMSIWPTQRVALTLAIYSVAGNTPAVQHLTVTARGGRQGQSIQPRENKLISKYTVNHTRAFVHQMQCNLYRQINNLNLFSQLYNRVSRLSVVVCKPFLTQYSTSNRYFAITVY